MSTLLLAGCRSDPAGRPSMLEVEAALSALLSDEVRLRQLSVVAPSSEQGKSSVSFTFCCGAFVLLYWLFMDETLCGLSYLFLGCLVCAIFIYTCHASWHIPCCAWQKLKQYPIYPPQNLPASVATRLAAGEKIAPELHENVAVVFVGVAGRHKRYYIMIIIPLYIASYNRVK